MAASYGTYPIFPPVVEGISGGREWNTDHISAVGVEVFNARWSEARWRFSLTGARILSTQIEEWDAFIDAIKGKHSPFLFWLKSARLTLDEEQIGTGDGSTTLFQLKKTRTYQGQSRVETIKYPIHSYPDITFAGGVVALPEQYLTVKVNGVTKTLTTHYTVNRETGYITFLSAPTNGHAVTVTGKYFVKCHMSSDTNLVQSEGGKAWTFDSGEIFQAKGD